VDKCFVATEDTARRARSMGLQDSQIVVHGLPIRPAFARRQPSKKTLRGKLGALPSRADALASNLVAMLSLSG
jgi:1,2-diacylglycerol 3-beta-galactosyltransferase